MSWRTEEILLATGGETLCKGRENIFNEVVTDSNKIESGSVFLALKGKRFDGHAFLRDAVRRGATCLVVHTKPSLSVLKEMTVIKVHDTLEALGDLAFYRRQIVAPKVLAITGSNGKTTIKEMVAAILERARIRGTSLQGRILKTEGNYNNLVGLPLTLLRLQGRERVAILELGTSCPGEIHRLTQIAHPDMGLICSVGPAHLAGLSSLAGVAREKGSLFQDIRPGGVAVVNSDDPWVRRLGERFKGKKIAYGRKGEVRGESCRCLGERGIEFTLHVGRKRRRIRLRLPGEHNLSNALGAAAMAYGLGVDLATIRSGLEAIKPFPMRMAIERWRGIGIINDTYNANPSSMEAALKTLAEIGGKRKKTAVLGDMLELGKESRKRHRELGYQAAQLDIDRLYLLGEHADLVKAGTVVGGMEESQVTIGRNHRQIARLARRQAKKGDWILFKGSRGMRLDKTLAEFKKIGK
ncbi:MAG: UDP-N-acetylmuramoyl-tripeptide--D-alanyl-D-alanine ligase [Candidatus Binatia bacterium]